MQWLLANWIWVLLVGAMIAMHVFGHRGRGRRGSGGKNANGGSRRAGENSPAGGNPRFGE